MTDLSALDPIAEMRKARAFNADLIALMITEHGPEYVGVALANLFDEIANVWRPIASAPIDDTLILARTDDGRVMVWSGKLLERAMGRTTPDHLRFPATRWMPIPRAAP